MKIAIIGYGKMGRMIEETALGRGHEITARIDLNGPDTLDSPGLREADVAIEFTTPTAAPVNLTCALDYGVSVVCGSTGWYKELPSISELAETVGAGLLYSSNFSIGMNLFMALNRYLSGLMSRFPEYRPSLSETHHIHKLDHPSGTAITLAEDLVSLVPEISGWKEIPEAEADAHTLPIEAVREGEVPGIHSVKWKSEADEITIRHEAFSRRGFALGAVMAAEWLNGRRGVFTMRDMLGDIFNV